MNIEELKQLSIADLKSIIDYCGDESIEEIHLREDAQDVLRDKLGLPR